MVLSEQHERELKAEAAAILRPPPTESVASWCERNVYVPAPQTQSPGFLRFAGREFCVEPLNLFGKPSILDVVLCFGSQIGKTTIFIGGICWTIINDACGVLWAMPSIELARSFSETRWQPVLKHSPDICLRIPTGKERHSFKKLQQMLKGGACINFIGSNSPSNLASRPARRVILDEVDKFDEGGNGEADAVNLAEQRTKSFSYPQRWKSSTPTTVDGLIWQEFLKGDQRRFLMPCPHCGKAVVFAWSKEMTVLPIVGGEAFIAWDKEAKRESGWDFDRVVRSARAVCPHCAGHIRDAEHKTRMVRAGEWKATATAPPSFRSYHASSLYASTPQTSFGAMALKFLQAKRSMQGLQGFINGDLAEPFENQDSRSERVEIIVRGADAAKAIGEGVKRFGTLDYQFTAPHFYGVIRDWTPTRSRLVKPFTANTWEEARKILDDNQCETHLVGIDCRHEPQEVFARVAEFGRMANMQGLRYCVSWVPMMGHDKQAGWTDKKTKKRTLFGLEECPLSHKRFRMKRLEFNSPGCLDILDRLRRGKAPGFSWELTEEATEEYFRHLDAKVKKPRAVGRTGRITWEWELRSSRWPDHWLDCEIEQVVFALFHRILPWGLPQDLPPPPK